MLIIFLILILFISIILVVHTLYSSRKTGVVPMPSSYREREKVVDILKQYKEIDHLTDLGSGWGGLVRKIHQNLPGIQITALEMSLVPVMVSRVIAGITKSKSIIYEHSNFLNVPLRNKEAYVCYLSGPGMKELRVRFEKDQPRGGILISIAFAMPGWTPVSTEYIKTLFHSPVYVYEF